MIQMYDGKWYHEDDIKSISFELYDYRLHNTSLEETIDKTDIIPFPFLGNGIILYLFFNLSLFFLWCYKPNIIFIGHVLMFSIFVFFLFLFIYFCSLLNYYLRLSSLPRTVRLTNGSLYILTPGLVRDFGKINDLRISRTSALSFDRYFPFYKRKKCYLLSRNFAVYIAVGIKENKYKIFGDFFHLLKEKEGLVNNFSADS